MATKKKGILTRAKEWWKHLRKYNKRAFWKGERRAVRRDIRHQCEPQRADRRVG